MAKKSEEKQTEITIVQLNQGELAACILGTMPLWYNAMSEKAWHELLMPAAKMNRAEKAVNLKHDPFAEYRNSVYKNLDNNAPTRLNFPAAAFKKAMAGAALDTPGAAKAQIGRLVWAVGPRVDIYGIPQLGCAIVRQSDQKRTPDVRTRAVLPEWACMLRLRFMTPILKEHTIASLLAIAGVIQGVGDWRQEKGSGSFGQFQIVEPDNPDFVRICSTMGQREQDAALENPTFFDEETARLMEWYRVERAKRDGKRLKVA